MGILFLLTYISIMASMIAIEPWGVKAAIYSARGCSVRFEGRYEASWIRSNTIRKQIEWRRNWVKFEFGLDFGQIQIQFAIRIVIAIQSDWNSNCNPAKLKFKLISVHFQSKWNSVNFQFNLQSKSKFKFKLNSV